MECRHTRKKTMTSWGDVFRSSQFRVLLERGGRYQHPHIKVVVFIIIFFIVPFCTQHFECLLLKENICISIKMLLEFDRKSNGLSTNRLQDIGHHLASWGHKALNWNWKGYDEFHAYILCLTDQCHTLLAKVMEYFLFSTSIWNICGDFITLMSIKRTHLVVFS